MSGASTAARYGKRAVMASRRASLRRDDRAATAIMEDLPSFLIVTIAVGMFLLSASKAIVAYRQSFDQAELLDEARAVVQYLRATPELVRDANAPMGAYSFEKARSLQAEVAGGAAASKAALDRLSVRAPATIRILDVSAYRIGEAGCPAAPAPCVVFEATSASAQVQEHLRPVIVSSPVTLSVTAREERVARLEVTLWPAP